MRFKAGKRCELRFSVPDTAAACIMLASGGARLYLAAILSSTIHEFGHLAAIKAYRKSVSNIIIFPFGVKIILSAKTQTTYIEDVITAAAGPTASLITALICLFTGKFFGSETFITAARVNFFLAALNLFPAKPLDGERILRGILGQIEHEKSDFICEKAAFISIISVEMLSAATAAYSGFNISVIIFCVYLLINLIREY